MKNTIRTWLVMLLCASASIAFAGETDPGTATTGADTGTSGEILGAVTISPSAGTYSSAQTLTLTNEGVNMCYTTDGSTPVCGAAGQSCTSGALYSSSFQVSSSRTINAVACGAQGDTGPMTSATYTITSSGG